MLLIMCVWNFFLFKRPATGLQKENECFWKLFFSSYFIYGGRGDFVHHKKMELIAIWSDLKGGSIFQWAYYGWNGLQVGKETKKQSTVLSTLAFCIARQ